MIFDKAYFQAAHSCHGGESRHRMRYDYVAAYKSATGREPSPEQIESYIYTYSDTDADYVLFQKALQGAMEAVGGTWCPAWRCTQISLILSRRKRLCLTV